MGNGLGDPSCTPRFRWRWTFGGHGFACPFTGKFLHENDGSTPMVHGAWLWHVAVGGFKNNCTFQCKTRFSVSCTGCKTRFSVSHPGRQCAGHCEPGPAVALDHRAHLPKRHGKPWHGFPCLCDCAPSTCSTRRSIRTRWQHRPEGGQVQSAGWQWCGYTAHRDGSEDWATSRCLRVAAQHAGVLATEIRVQWHWCTACVPALQWPARYEGSGVGAYGVVGVQCTQPIGGDGGCTHSAVPGQPEHMMLQGANVASP